MEFNIGDKVQVKSLRWFEENCELLFSNDFYYKDSNGVNTLRVTPEMLQFCGRLVTISGFEYSYYKLAETPSLYWSGDFFLSSDTAKRYSYSKDVYYNSIKDYCSNFCVFKDNSKCNNLECPLYKFN